MARKMNGLSRDLIIHPGETLKEMLRDRNINQRELAMRTGLTEKHISNVVNCKKPISVSFAKKLEYVFGVDASFWISLQGNYDRELADFEEIHGVTDHEIEILGRLSAIVEHLQELRLVEQESDDSLLVIALRRFLNVSNLANMANLSRVGAYRIAKRAHSDPFAVYTWLRMCDAIVDADQSTIDLDTHRLRANLPLIRELMFEDAATIQPVLKAYLSECGIKFTIVKHFPGVPIQGVITKDEDGTLGFIMTVRYKFADIFWFTLFHEIGHILNGDVADHLIDYDCTENEVEKKADEFAANILIDPEEYERFVASGDYSLRRIKQFCVGEGIPPYILIGRLQRDRYLQYDQHSKYKVRYELEDLVGS